MNFFDHRKTRTAYPTTSLSCTVSPISGYTDGLCRRKSCFTDRLAFSRPVNQKVGGCHTPHTHPYGTPLVLTSHQNCFRRCLSGMYGGTVHYDSDECSFQLQEYNRLEEEADRSASRWDKIWKKFEPPKIQKKVCIMRLCKYCAG